MRGAAKIFILSAAATLLGVIIPAEWTYKGLEGGHRVDEVAAEVEAPSPGRAGEPFSHTPSTCEELAGMLENKRLKLVEREGLISLREERILSVQKRVEDRIAQLKSLREEIEEAIEQQNAREEERLNKLARVEEERLNKLAKVYEATEPEEAGRLLSRLDVKLAAKILFKMSDAKAGRLWAYVKPEQAMKISEEIYNGRDEGEER
jgi:flagellar motility protein MotE (MotC chaperone)